MTIAASYIAFTDVGCGSIYRMQECNGRVVIKWKSALGDDSWLAKVSYSRVVR